jgi:uncharacterized protein
MLFKRRSRTTFRERVRLWLRPRTSWRRSVAYHLKRLFRLSGSRYAIAMGCAVGAFASCTPLIGFHFLVSVAIAWLVRGNMIAAAIGTIVGNPLTFPLIWASTFKVGQLMLPGPDQNAPPTLALSLEQKSVSQIWPLLKPMLLGSIPVGLIVGCITYVIVYRVLTAVRSARQARLAECRDSLTERSSKSAPMRCISEPTVSSGFAAIQSAGL